MTEYGPVLTLKEAKEYLKVSKAQLYRYINSDVNPLPVVYLSPSSPRILKSKLDEWIAQLPKIINQ